MSTLIHAAPGFINVRDHGAVGDGKVLETSAFERALAAAETRGGGTVYVPPGRYLSGSLFLRSHVNLHLDAGAVLIGSTDPNDYPIIRTRWEGREVDGHAALIAGQNLEHVAVTGLGLIEGQGQPWWQALHKGRLKHSRPRLIQFEHCRNVRIEGVTLRDAPAWTVSPTCCDNVAIQGVTIYNPPDSPNTDGINPDSCRNVRITDCHIDVGDDCIAIKAGTEHAESDVPCENIIISNCTMVHGHGGVVIGSEMSGSVRDVMISNCVFRGTERGIRIKTRRGRGGTIENVIASQIAMRDVACPLVVNMYYQWGLDGEEEKATLASDRSSRPLDKTTPRIRHLQFTHITAQDVVGDAAAFFLGLPESPIEDVTLDNVTLDLTDHAGDAIPSAMALGGCPETEGEIYAQHVASLKMHQVKLLHHTECALRLLDARDVQVHHLTAPASGDQPMLSVKRVQGLQSQGCAVVQPEDA